MQTNPNYIFKFPPVIIREIALPDPSAIKIGPFGSQLKKEDLSREGYKVYGQENIIANDFSIGTRRVDTTKFSSLISCRLFPGDLVLTMMGTVGKCAIFPKEAEVGIMDSHLLRIQVDPKIADSRFIAMMIAAEEVVGQQVERLSHGSIMSGLSSTIVQSLQIPLPPLTEQRRIADILDTIGSQIKHTEQLITKLKWQKAGLRHKLLIYGLDRHGQLRDPVAHPEEFRESELGRIPKEWEVQALVSFAQDTGNAFVNGPFGSDLLAKELLAEGIPVIYIRDIKEGTYERVSTVHVSAKKAESLSFCDVQYGDILVTKVGDPPGIAAPYLLNEKAIITQDVIRIKVRKDIDPHFLNNLLNSHFGKRAVEVITIVSSRKRFSLTDFKNIRLPKPPLEEQTRIIQCFDAVESEIRAEEAYHDKLKLYKKGLMQDLLTGRVCMSSEEKIFSGARFLCREAKG